MLGLLIYIGCATQAQPVCLQQDFSRHALAVPVAHMHTPRPTGDRGDMTGDDKESFKVRPRLAALHPTSQARTCTWRLALERRAAPVRSGSGAVASGPECHCALRCAPGTRCPLEARGCARSLLA